MPRKVSRGRAVSRAILLTLAVTTQYVSRVPGAPSHTGAVSTPDKAQEKVLRGSQQKSTDTADRDARTRCGGVL